MGSVDSKPNDGTKFQYYTRRAHHAGSWYADDGAELREGLESFLRDAEDATAAAATTTTTPTSSVGAPEVASLRGLIVPHAGYSYSGRTAAFAYAALRRELRAREDTASTTTTTILVLHPSHHVHLPQQCAISCATVLQTPLGNLSVNDALRREILNLNLETAPCSSSRKTQPSPPFTLMTASEDEQEHSGEMQYPYLACCIPSSNNKNITVLPVMCGSLSTESEIFFGEKLREIIHRPEIITVVSTDFCHWGRRFDYQPTPNDAVNVRDSSRMPIHDFIEQMDRRGMDLIAAREPGAFAAYLKETRNTICGRHAVAVWLRAVAASDVRLSIDFVRYAQSSPSKTLADSSVSYAAAVITTTTCPSSTV